MTASSGAAVLALLVALGGATAARAAETYSYTIHHPTFGDIGTYTDRIAQTDGALRIDTSVHIVVRTLGIVLHREDADRTELWHGNRLAEFHGVTWINGKPLEVRGEARPDGFVISTPTGTAVAPADLVPSDPWQLGRFAGGLDGSVNGTLFSTRTGRLVPFQLTGGETMQLTVHGRAVAVRHFVVNGQHRQEVWIDGHGVPVAFRTIENDTPIDFTLSREGVAAGVASSD